MILGGGAAGFAAADMLRRDAYDGPITMISADRDPPVDRPNLSKDFLAGEAKDDWIPLWSPDLYGERRIELLLGICRVLNRSGRAYGASRERNSVRVRQSADCHRCRSRAAAHSWS